MKKNIYVIGLALSVSLLSSCGDYLDVKPVGKMIPTEVSQFENVLNNTTTLSYQFMDNNRGCSYAFLGDNLQISENQMKFNYIASFPNQDLIAAYKYYSPMLDPKSTPMWWTYGYRALGLFNNIIDGVSGIDAESAYAKGVIAEAKVGRAWIYMNFALMYGPMYNPNSANDTKVIPFRLSGDPTVANGDLATTAQVFAGVKEDLDYACENCPQTVSNPSRANKAAAYAARAEYYMYLRDWQNMLADSKKAWDLALENVGGDESKLIYNFADFSYYSTSPVEPDPGCDKEYYMDIQGPDNVFDQTTNRENLLYRIAPSSRVVSRFYPSDDWASIFDKEHDLRWKLFALKAPGYTGKQGGESYDDGPRVLYTRADNLSNTQAYTHPLLLLMKAEAEARTGDRTAALADLNILRKYRYSGEDTSLKDASLSGDKLLEEILNERRREQPLVSIQRTLDLKRYVFDIGKPWCKTTITHKCGAKTYSKAITDAYYQSLNIDNAILKYNPQWGISLNTDNYEPYNAD